MGVCAVAAAVGLAAAACGSDTGDSASLDDFLPPVPPPTGEAQTVFAGAITSADELIPGAAAHGMVGDYFMRNSRARFVIQSPARVIGVVPQGGNLVDAVAIDEDGNDVSEDHFGELSAVYLVGRTCEHESVEVVQDGSGGGAAVVRARGHSAVNDFINLKGIGALSIPDEIDPDIDDAIECATTYVLQPDSAVLEVYWTFFNPEDGMPVTGPFGMLNDTGGVTEVFAPTRGFERAGLDAITTLADPTPIDYIVYQGPGVAYGLVPVYEPGAEAPNSQVTIAGVSIVLYGAEALLDVLNEDHWYFQLPPGAGATHRVDVVVAADAADIESEFLSLRGRAAATVTGTARYAGGESAPGVRVGLYVDADGDGAIGPDDPVRTYAVPDATGAFTATVEPGRYLARAEVYDRARSDAVAVDASSGTASVDLSLPEPVAFDYTIVDDETGNTIPGRLVVVGEHPAQPDTRLFDTSDRMTGVVTMIPSAYGTSVDMGDGADEPLELPPGRYRVYATRGTEWSVDWADLDIVAGDPPAELTFRLRQVAPTPGYLATEFHQHSIGSPDSIVTREDRIRTFVSEGVEFFASTDHDFVSDFQPIIEAMGLDRYLRAVPGEEVTPFAFGHFQAFPIKPTDDNPSHGAIDWARGTAGYAMIPGEIWDAARSAGAEVIQVNHPRATSADFSDMMQYFDRCGLTFDYDRRAIDGDPDLGSVPLQWLRFPEVTTIWDDSFDALEVWNGHKMKDTNGDGVRENMRLDRVMRDWFNFLSFGLEISPMGNSDTHKVVSDHTGMPRTMVRVPGDTAADLANPGIVDDVIDTLTGRGGTPRDIIMTNGPHIMIDAAGFTGSPIGSVVDGTSGSVDLTIRVYAPDWAEFDTIELFVNSTPNSRERKETWLQPAACFTSRDIDTLPDNAPCALAPIAPRAMTVDLVDVAPGYQRYEATVTFTLSEADMAMLNREGATGTDAWVVVRVRGDRGIFPVMENGIDASNLEVLTTGDKAAIDAAMRGIGIPATAVTAPVYVDFDGGGYRAPFAP
ncbi:MAG: hypothetical protein D6689_15355 [Deltaproteobacteria bacterium]|nr:MAG: hypothetical protein D6689_15355 [Deltaproteobacteria bacterium]